MKNWQTFSIRSNSRTVKVFGFLILLTVLTALASICFGPVFVSPALLPKILLGQLTGTTEAKIVLLARLPRTAGCLLAGMALAVSGAVIQSVLHNPLAAPNIIGVNSGAGLMVVLVGAVAPYALWLTPLAAFLEPWWGYWWFCSSQSAQEPAASPWYWPVWRYPTFSAQALTR